MLVWKYTIFAYEHKTYQNSKNKTFFQIGPHLRNMRHLLDPLAVPEANSRSSNQNNNIEIVSKSSFTTPFSTPRGKTTHSLHMCWIYRQSPSDFLCRNQHHCHHYPTRTKPGPAPSSFPRELGLAVQPGRTTNRPDRPMGKPNSHAAPNRILSTTNLQVCNLSRVFHTYNWWFRKIWTILSRY